jgi:hypothetical protein
LEVVRGREVRDVCAELPALRVRGTEVESRPDACQDKLVERLREAGERSRRIAAGIREHAGDLIAAHGSIAEEQLQHAGVRAVEAEMSRHMIGIGR